jgi:uncharacterized protein YceH (UPF0502 family)
MFGAMLTIIEARVLGCLLEKERTTPEQYPLTLNALVTACNQATSREPVMSLDPREVESTIDGLKAQKLARLVHPSHGRSVTRYRQVIDEVQGWTPAHAAVMTLLLLRGPQTVNELRTRAERMYTFASLEEVETALAELAARDEPHVVRLERQIGQKELRWRQLIAEEAEPSAVPARSSVGTGAGGGLAERVAQLEAGNLELEERVAKLEAALRDLSEVRCAHPIAVVSRRR